MKQRKIAGTVNDPTLPKTPIIVKGKTYNLCFTFGALAEAETEINLHLARKQSNERVNMLLQFPVQNLANTRACFAAALRTFHPEIEYEQAVGMIDPTNVLEIAGVVQDAWTSAFPESKEAPADPPQPGG